MTGSRRQILTRAAIDLIHIHTVVWLSNTHSEERFHRMPPSLCQAHEPIPGPLIRGFHCEWACMLRYNWNNTVIMSLHCGCHNWQNHHYHINDWAQGGVRRNKHWQQSSKLVHLGDVEGVKISLCKFFLLALGYKLQSFTFQVKTSPFHWKKWCVHWLTFYFVKWWHTTESSGFQYIF